MDVVIGNCNNIRNGSIKIVPNKLNIKYGINGTGKSTISNAIGYIVDGKGLMDLKPFNSLDDAIPTIDGIDDIRTVKIYNDNYVSKYLFLQNGDNLHQNSFEVFIKPDNYDESIEQINNILSIVKNYVIENDTINTLIEQKEELAKILKLNSNKTSINATGVGKALNIGNKITNIPDDLNGFSTYLNDKNKVSWYKWQNEGRTYVKENKCPFCTTLLEERTFNSLMQQLDKLFDKTNVSNILKTENIIDTISESLNDDTKKFFNNVLRNDKPIDNDTKQGIANFIIELETVCEKLNFFKQLNYYNLNNIDNLEEQLLSSKFTVDNLKFINNDNIINIINELNNKIDEMIIGSQSLKTKISELNYSIRKYTLANKIKINDFLFTVGMNYEVDVENNKLILFYKGSNIIVDVNNHLSWGEKNAFALSLFLFDCLHNNPDLIILDDPVSSFDFNKKYAITHYLFGGNRSLNGKTVLMLTHDLEPIIDMLKIKKMKYLECYYIENNNGELVERIILQQDINSIINVAKACFSNENLNIINRLVHLRRYLELNNEYDFEYNMISSLLKGYEIPKYRDLIIKTDRNFTEGEFLSTEENIQKFIPNFKYNKIRCTIYNKSTMKQLYQDSDNNYEKIEIFRIILKTFGLPNVNPITEQFINEAFHIENTYIFQLDPYAYNVVPNYIIEMCNKVIERMPIEIVN